EVREVRRITPSENTHNEGSGPGSQPYVVSGVHARVWGDVRRGYTTPQGAGAMESRPLSSCLGTFHPDESEHQWPSTLPLKSRSCAAPSRRSRPFSTQPR